MAIHLRVIPFDAEHETFDDEDVNKFLLNKKVKIVKPEFFHANGKVYWTICVDYECVFEQNMRVTESLNEPQRLLLQRFREWRRETAQKEGIPVFIIATNKQLLQLVKSCPRSLEALRQLHGFGKKKIERYGKTILDMIQAFYDNQPAQ